jgi:hypothetical protein
MIADFLNIDPDFSRASARARLRDPICYIFV